MTLDTIQNPTPSITTVTTALSRHARANPSDDLVIINTASSRATFWTHFAGESWGRRRQAQF